ncbi:hypothetical protein MJ561_27675 [Klebsiella pneumoniae]|nr:hypothetical protein MJ561_27675 [Klebsiella pneumoniae]
MAQRGGGKVLAERSRGGGCEELATFDYLYLSSIGLAILSPASRDRLFTLLRECRANGGE